MFVLSHTSTRSTNNHRPDGLVVETRRATISFNPGLCWYLDSNFCSSFHMLKVWLLPMTTNQIMWMIRAILFAVWLFAILRVIQHFILVAKRSIEEDTAKDEERAKREAQAMGINNEAMLQLAKSHQGTKMRIAAGLDALAHQRATGWMGRGVLIVAPITFYFNVFMPCWECFDFEAAATHEIGHVLGLSHPDEVAATAPGRPGMPGGENAMLSANLTNGFDCNNPWASAMAHPGGNNDTKESIMRTLTQHNPRVCITEDDLEALNVLYPDCSQSMITTPVCYYAPKYIGWARFFGLTFVPILVTCASVIMLNECVRRRSAHKMKKIEDDLMDERMKRDDEVKKMVTHIVAQREKELRREYRRRGRRGKVQPGDDDDVGAGALDAPGLQKPKSRFAMAVKKKLEAKDIEQQIEQLKTDRTHDRPPLPHSLSSMGASSMELIGHDHDDEHRQRPR